MENVKEEYKEVRSIFNGGRSISSVLVDPFEELVWVGNQSGYLTSYYGAELQKYTSFRGHHSEVRHIIADDRGVFSMSSNNICYAARQGLRHFNLRGENLSDMQCMLQKDNSSLLVAGHQDLILEIDVSQGQVVKEIEVNPGTVVMKRSSRFVCCGDTSGKVILRDPSTLNTEHVFEAHAGTLSDFDVSGNMLVTCGFSPRHGQLAVDRFAMVYDLRILRSLPPLQLPLIEPLMLKFVPAFSSRLAVISQNGQFQFHEPGGLVTPSSMLVYHVNTHGNICLAFDISATCQVIVFGDSGGYLHLWEDTQEKDATFNTYSRPTEFAPEVPHVPPLAIDDYSLPLSSFPLPFSNEPMLSDWPKEKCIRQDRKTPAIDPEILRTMVVRHFIGYAPSHGKIRRNQVAYQLPRTGTTTSQGRKEDMDIPESPANREEDPESVIPKHYRRVEIKYSKLGVDNFDFRHYNKTSFAGLEIDIPNAYCNAMLQVFYFLEPMRCSMQSHLCQREFCLACELGFLFHMLDKSNGQTCQANNFLRAFRTLPEASALGLVLNDADETTGKSNFRRLIQSWTQFILQQMHQDTLDPTDSQDNPRATVTEQNRTDHMSIVHRLFGSEVEQESRCRCDNQQTRTSTTMLYDLEYPELSQGKAVSFESVMTASLFRQKTTQAWCEKCAKYQPTVQSRKVKSLPEVFMLNCRMDHGRDVDFWKGQQELLNVSRPVEEKPASQGYNSRSCRYGDKCNRSDCKFSHDKMAAAEAASRQSEPEDIEPDSWLPAAIKVSLSNSEGLVITRLEEEQKVKCAEGEVVYDLFASVGHIQDVKSGCNLVAHIHVGTTYHSRKEGVTCSQWYLFNDFAITPISGVESRYFNLDWKMPCVIILVRRDINSRHDVTIKNKLEDSILNRGMALARRDSHSREFTPLTPDELQKLEDGLVGLDAEFVTLNQAEAEIKSDGTRSTIKPSQMSVARITAVRGDGPLSGVPFIDDYISTSEQVVDYLTQFSGIKPGDLDATLSSKHVTTLKTTYQKLLALIDRNVKFVGHGLKKDFRVINILVPKNQVYDTVELFHIPKQRFLSLRFLAWYFLGLTIQSETHDSTEDARTALMLYHKYKELKREGEQQLKKVLKQLYEDGRRCGWKVGETSEESSKSS